jgi:hypothetical protein
VLDVILPVVTFPPEVALVMLAAELILLAVSFCANEPCVAKARVDAIAIKESIKIISCLIICDALDQIKVFKPCA